MSDISIPDLKAIYKGALKHKNRCTLEIGANDGEDTAILLSMDPNCRVHCFEPDPRAIARWRMNCLDERSVLYEIALSDTAGSAVFYPSGGNPGGRWQQYGQWDKSGSLLPFDRHCENAPWMEHPPPFTVQTMRLDDWTAQHLSDDTVVSLAWIDVQGAEDKVLTGAVATLPRIKYIFCECCPLPNYVGQPTKQQLLDILAGFQFIGEYGHNLLFKNKFMENGS